jgi:hypothetical protein
VYQTELETDRGLLLGVAYKNFQLTGCFYNTSTDNTFVMISLAADF